MTQIQTCLQFPKGPLELFSGRSRLEETKYLRAAEEGNTRAPSGPGEYGSLLAGFKIRLARDSRKSQKEGQEDQASKRARGTPPPSCFKVPWSSWPSLGLLLRLPGNPSTDPYLEACF
jgi:hypothetical protein